MEIGELVAPPSLSQEFSEKCPFKQELEDGPAKADEDLSNDDLEGQQGPQANDGGILGQNLEAGKLGVADGGPFPADDFAHRQPANDTNRGRKTRLRLAEYKDANAGDFPLTVAAHHLIPGNASLYKAAVQLVDFLKDGGKVRSLSGKTYTIKGNIGYDVNGSHNGIWLPGPYAIKTALPERKKGGKVLPARPGTTPVSGVGWADLADDHEEWRFKYVAGACKAAGGQFHDSHEQPYSATVRKNLRNIVVALAYHLDYCPECSGKSEPVPPPFRIKRRLYALSQKLRSFVGGSPGGWKVPWFTSEYWSGRFFAGGKLSQEFQDAYLEARETTPATIPDL
jgi:hypothetical protein